MKLFQFAQILFASCALAFASGCASVASDPESTTRFESSPTGANCIVSNNRGFRQEFKTPMTMTLHRDIAPVSVSCTADGHAPANETIQMTTDGWIAGNLLLGGIVGIAIDAASGAGNKFPPEVSILMDPNDFKTFRERDQWYEKRKAKLEAHFTQETARTLSLNACRGRALDCDDLMDDLNNRKKKEFKRLETARDTATIANTASAIPLGRSGSCLVQTGVNRWEPRNCPGPKSVTSNAEPKKVTIDGKETCLTQSEPGTWKSGPCPKEPEITEVMIDGRKQCLVRAEADTWKAHTCPN